MKLGIDVYDGSRSKSARAHRARHKQKIISVLQQAGAEVMLMDKTLGHYRLKLSTGVLIDFWVTTLKWRTSIGQGPHGETLAELLAVLADPPPPMPASVGASEDGLVTIFTDASFDHRTLDGGWASWIKSVGPGIFDSGHLKECPTSMEAELRALAMGLHQAVARGILRTRGAAILQSDSIGALGIILGRVEGTRHSRSGGNDATVIPAALRPNKSVRASTALQHIQALVRTHQLRLIVRHVRGHQQDDNGRSGINREVDRLARKAAREFRARMKEHA